MAMLHAVYGTHIKVYDLPMIRVLFLQQTKSPCRIYAYKLQGAF